MKFRIIAVGLLKKGPEKDLIDHYLKQKNVFEIDEIDARKFSSQADWQSEIEKKLENNKGFTIFMDETGKEFSSEKFAEFIEEKQLIGISDLTFVIGGADGFEASFLKKYADLKLCLGRMTWPHMMARVMLVEQLYRALQIIDKHPYHRT